DPTREGLRQTPARVEASLKWLTRGYHMAVADVIGDALYSERHENLVCVRDIEIYSLCEHHLLPFFGRAHVAYLPNGRLVGLSKIPRVIEVFARRLQVQERLTDQVAEELQAAGSHVVRLSRSLAEASADRRTDLPCDVSDPAAVARVAARILAERGVPDIIVNNAGIFFIKPVADATPDDFARTISVN